VVNHLLLYISTPGLEVKGLTERPGAPWSSGDLPATGQLNRLDFLPWAMFLWRPSNGDGAA
jgi:hypothetical protein